MCSRNLHRVTSEFYLYVLQHMHGLKMHETAQESTPRSTHCPPKKKLEHSNAIPSTQELGIVQNPFSQKVENLLLR